MQLAACPAPLPGPQPAGLLKPLPSVCGCARMCNCPQVYGLRPFRIPLRWDFMNRTDPQEPVYSGVT